MLKHVKDRKMQEELLPNQSYFRFKKKKKKKAISVLTGNYRQVQGGVRLLFDPWSWLPAVVNASVLSSNLRDQKRTVLWQWDSVLLFFIDISQFDQFQGYFADISERPGCTFTFHHILLQVSTDQHGLVSFPGQLWDPSCCQTIMSDNNQ